MYYSIRHVTRFRYSQPISESMMEVRMQPRTEGVQRCLQFNLSVKPKARVMAYRDFLSNTVHHFGVPGAHRDLAVIAEALVEVRGEHEPPAALAPSAWDELDALTRAGDYWETLAPSAFAQPTGLLLGLVREFGAVRRDDPLSLLNELNARMYDAFDYVPRATKVDSPIDEALRSRHGVCQDFAHIFIALLRHIGIPARYVSGYLYHRRQDHDRSAEGATHAWVEALLPHLGWVGFDPTNNLIAGQRHIRTAIGRDYADVPPTKGVYKGAAESSLAVVVRVSPSDAAPPADDLMPMPVSEHWSPAAEPDRAAIDYQQQQQQQQQQ
ncbi:MAG TPA: transglutaminase family protein [Solibacterales bacterium]|nr:transglutaminase family protein [Bryobacterales bacterium]